MFHNLNFTSIFDMPIIFDGISETSVINHNFALIQLTTVSMTKLHFWISNPQRVQNCSL